MTLNINESSGRIQEDVVIDSLSQSDWRRSLGSIDHEDGPRGNVVEVDYLLLLRKCRKSLGGEHSVGMWVGR